MLDIEKIKENIKKWPKEYLTTRDLVEVGMFERKQQIYDFNKRNWFSEKYAFDVIGNVNVYRKADLLNFFYDESLFPQYERLFKVIKPKEKKSQTVPSTATVTTEQIGFEIAKFLMDKYVLRPNT
jgi:hypothetical protein